jgi:hypothetical protein
VLRALLTVYVHEPNPKDQADWLGFLAAMIGAKLSPDGAKDRELRAKFASAIQDPPKAEVASRFQAAAAEHPADARLKRLAEAWSH